MFSEEEQERIEGEIEGINRSLHRRIDPIGALFSHLS